MTQAALPDPPEWAATIAKLNAEPHHSRCSSRSGQNCDCYKTTRIEYVMAAALAEAEGALARLQADLDSLWEPRAEAAEEQVAALRRKRDEIAATREQALSDYRDCREEGSHAEAARYDTVASSLALALRLIDAALSPGGADE